jgi:hypothetical protein
MDTRTIGNDHYISVVFGYDLKKAKLIPKIIHDCKFITNEQYMHLKLHTVNMKRLQNYWTKTVSRGRMQSENQVSGRKG